MRKENIVVRDLTCKLVEFDCVRVLAVAEQSRARVRTLALDCSNPL